MTLSPPTSKKLVLFSPDFEENSPNTMRRIGSAPNVRYHKESDAIAEVDSELSEGAEQVEKVLLRDNSRRKSRFKSWLG